MGISRPFNPAWMGIALWLRGEHPLLFALGIALVFGLLLTGIVTFQAGVFPRPAAALLLAATAGFFFVFFVAEFLPPLAGQLGSALFGQ